MAIERTSYRLIDEVVSRDIFSEHGVLLIPAGTTLEAQHITLLIERRIHEIDIGIPSPDLAEQIESAPISPQITTQLQHVFREQELREHYIKVLGNIKALFESADGTRIPPIDQIIDAYKTLSNIHVKQGYFFLQFNKLKGHDEYTYRHALNVSVISSLIGKIIGLPSDTVELLGVMGLLHDIGKMKVPPEILNKPGKLTPEEFEIMKAHTLYGYEMLKNIEGTNERILQSPLYHHERLDGSGYPSGLTGSQIPLEVQIIAIADVFDAIGSDRVYKEKDSSYFAALELMKEAYDYKLNIQIVLPFVYYLIEGYIGGIATLSSGEIAEVMMIHTDEPHRPLLRIGSRYVDMRKARHLEIVNLIAP